MLKQTPKNRVLFVRRFTPVLVLIFGVFCIAIANLQSARLASAATANTINFQARLQTASGAIVPDGSYNVEFKLYSASSGGSALWTEDYYNNAGNGINTINGYLTANLGSINPFPSNINWDQQLWITMNIGGTTTGTPILDGEMNPRLQMTAVPYAFKAGQLAQYNAATGFTSTLSLIQPTGGNQLFQIPDQGAAGTYNLLTTSSAATGFIQNSTSLQSGANFNISGNGTLGGTLSANAVMITGTALTFSTSGTIQSTGTNALSLDTGGAGTINIGNSNATQLSIGTSNVAKTISIGTGGTSTMQTINIGSTNTGSVTTVQAGSGGLNLQSAGGLTIDTTSAGQTLAIGNSAVTHTISIGTAAAAQGITLGSTNSTSSVLVQAGTGNLQLQTQGGTLGIGNNAITQTINIGNSTGNTSVSVLCGNFACGFGNNATAHSTIIGSATSASATTIQAGTGGISLAQNTVVSGTLSAASAAFSINASGNVTYVASTTAGSTLVCKNASNQLAGCSSTYETSTGTDFIKNQTTQQIGANIDIQGASSSVAAVIQGASGQNIMNLVNSAGATVVAVDSVGDLTSTGTITGAYVSGQGGSFSGSTSTGAIDLSVSATNTNTSSSSVSAYGIGLQLAGSANTSGSNIDVGIGFSSPTATTGNTFVGLQFGSGYNAILAYNASTIIDGTGIIQNAALSSSIAYSNITQVGALTVGSIATGFGTISTANNITTTAGLFGGTGLISSTSTTAFQVQNASSTTILGVDTTNSKINVTGMINFTASGLIQAPGAGGSGYLSLDTSGSSGTVFVGNSVATNVYIATTDITHAIYIGSGGSTTNQVINIGSKSAASATNIQGGTGNINITTGGTGASTIIKSSTNSTAALQVQNSSSVDVLSVDTTNNRVVIGAGSTGESTPKLLVLDNGTSSSDPTEVDGALYYNANTKSFRCGINGSFRDCMSNLGFSNTAPSGPIDYTNAGSLYNWQTSTSSTSLGYSMLANDCQPGVTYLITASGLMSTGTFNSDNGRLALDLDGTGTTLATTSNFKPSGGTTALTNVPWQFTAQMICDTTGTSGTIEVQGSASYPDAAAGASNLTLPTLNTSTLTFNTTTSHTLYMGFRWNSATSGASVTMRQFIVQRMGPS